MPETEIHGFFFPSGTLASALCKLHLVSSPAEVAINPQTVGEQETDVSLRYILFTAD